MRPCSDPCPRCHVLHHQTAYTITFPSMDPSYLKPQWQPTRSYRAPLYPCSADSEAYSSYATQNTLCIPPRPGTQIPPLASAPTAPRAAKTSSTVKTQEIEHIASRTAYQRKRYPSRSEATAYSQAHVHQPLAAESTSRPICMTTPRAVHKHRVSPNIDSRSLYGRDKVANVCAKWLRKFCADFDRDAPLCTMESPIPLEQLIAYMMHRARFSDDIAHYALLLLDRLPSHCKVELVRTMNRNIHHMFVAAVRMAVKFLLDDQYNLAGWVELVQNWLNVEELVKLDKILSDLLNWRLSYSSHEFASFTQSFN